MGDHEDRQGSLPTFTRGIPLFCSFLSLVGRILLGMGKGEKRLGIQISEDLYRPPSLL